MYLNIHYKKKKHKNTLWHCFIHFLYAPENLIGVISAGSRMATGLADPTAMGPDPGWRKPGGKMAMLAPLQKKLGGVGDKPWWCVVWLVFLPEVVIQRIACFLFLEAHASPLIAGKSSTNMLMITSKMDGRTAKMTRFVLAALPQPDIVICSEIASDIGDVSSNIGDAASTSVEFRCLYWRFFTYPQMVRWVKRVKHGKTPCQRVYQLLHMGVRRMCFCVGPAGFWAKMFT